MGGKSLSIVNVTDPANMLVAGTYAQPGGIVGVWPEGNLTFATSFTSTELVVFDTSDLGNVKLVSSTPVEHPWSFEVVVSGNYAYVGEQSELEVIDVSHPEAPVHAGQFPVTGIVRQLVLRDHYAYLVDPYQGLVIADVSTPTAPTPVSVTTTPDAGPEGPWGLAVDGSNAYVVSSTLGVLVFDVSDPSSPIQIATLGDLANTGVHEIAVGGGYAFLAGAGQGLLVADVTDPSNPKLVTASPTSVSVSGIALDESAQRVYVIGSTSPLPNGGSGTLEVFDISTPAAPVKLGGISTLDGNPYTALEIQAVP